MLFSLRRRLCVDSSVLRLHTELGNIPAILYFVFQSYFYFYALTLQTASNQEKVLFEGDINLLDGPEENTGEGEAENMKRSVVRNQVKLWTDRVIPYEFTSEVGKCFWRGIFLDGSEN